MSKQAFHWEQLLHEDSSSIWTRFLGKDSDEKVTNPIGGKMMVLHPLQAETPKLQVEIKRMVEAKVTPHRFLVHIATSLNGILHSTASRPETIMVPALPENVARQDDSPLLMLKPASGAL